MSKYDVRFVWGDYPNRQRQANGLNAVCYVEQHFNAADDPSAHGTEVIVSTNASATSKAWGRAYAQRVSKDLDTTLRHPKDGGILVGGYGGRGNGNLSSTAMPAILLEPCYASNSAEAAKIRDPFYQKVLAKALSDTIKEIFPKGGIVAFSVGHKGKTSKPYDRGTPVLGGGMESDYAEIVLKMASEILMETEVVVEERVAEIESDTRENMARKILNFEARRDSLGHLAIYKLPAGDGGGDYEVAGINNQYHPQMAYKLKCAIERREWQGAEDLAISHIAAYTDVVLRWFEFDGVDHSDYYPGIEFFLRDSSFNRGPTGAAKILQRALSVKTDGSVGPNTKAAFKDQLHEDASELLDRLRAAREWYERVYARRDESSKFWKGLVNRWNNALQISQELA
jgi:hypothetical protein